MALAWMAVICPSGFATNGMELPGFGAVNRSMGGAGVASPQDSAWEIINPAGIAGMDRRLDFLGSVLVVRRTLEPHGLAGNPFNGELVDNTPAGGADVGLVLPTPYFTFGAGFFVLEALSASYTHPRSIVPKLTLGNWDRRLEIFGGRIPLTFAKKFDFGLSVGVAVNIDVRAVCSDHLTLQLRQTKGDFDWDFSYGGGLTIGAIQQWERISIGAAYTTEQWMTKFYHYDDLFPHPMDSPQKLQAGVAIKILEPLEFDLDYKWLDWAGVPQFGRAILQGGMGWHSQNIVMTGLAWTINEKWTVRTGFSYGNSPINSEHVFIDALGPLIFTTHTSLGATYKLSKNSEVSLTYTLHGPKTMKESGKGDLFSHLGRGTEVSIIAHNLSFGYTVHF
jgi:long-chain fatty acid transport protein